MADAGPGVASGACRSPRDPSVLIGWARSQGFRVQHCERTTCVRFTAPAGAFVALWDAADPDRLAELVPALRRFGLVWPPPPRRPRS